VLSTLHTNDSVAAVTRLLDLHIPPFLVSSSVTGIIAQRLVRKLCSCRKEVPVTPEYTARLLSSGIVDFEETMYVPVGCAACDDSGYKGRCGIYELLYFDEQVRAAVRSETRDDEMRSLARSAGMKLMQEDALDKVRGGTTTLDEVMRVVPFESVQALRCPQCEKTVAPTFLFCPYCGVGTHPKGAGMKPGPKRALLAGGSD
jgi:type II secretory ATPase GspE/PulE/Tfp pilus assembly ATPase PilB-like protein